MSRVVDEEAFEAEGRDPLADVTPPGLYDDATGDYHHERDHGEVVEEDERADLRGAVSVLRRGMAVSPELRAGLWFTALLAVGIAAGKLMIPILIQQVLDKGVTGPEGFRPGVVYGLCTAAFVGTVLLGVTGRFTYLRLVTAAEGMLFSLRVKVFEHIHRLSIADHNESRRGLLTARCTSDIETIARFAQWGGIAWIVNSVVIVGTLVVMAVYSWRLTLVVIVVFLPLLPLMRRLQRRQLDAYDEVRNRVSDTMSEVSESVMGASILRAYGLQERIRGRLHRAIDDQYRSEMAAARYFAFMFTLSDVFGAIALATTVAVGAWWGPGWGMDIGDIVAFVFLVQILLMPVAELGEILDQTQTAIAGWRKVLDVLDVAVEVVEPQHGPSLPDGSLSIRAEDIGFAYREGGLVLRDVGVEIPAGANVAVVGETGSGKTTFAKLLCRLADPTSGRIIVGGLDLRTIDPSSRRKAIRMVPQDGFLFDTTVRANVLFGLDGAAPDAADAAFRRLGLEWWVERLPEGLDTAVGERGENLSVGERQLVALARAELVDPGLLILDEATSAIDPETERALSVALEALSAGRTTVSVAHRLSTAETADLILVFDAGRVVERGPHDALVAAGGIYANLYESWLGNTQR